MTEFVSGPPGQYVTLTLPNFRVCARQKVPAKCFKIVDIWPRHTLGEDIKEHEMQKGKSYFGFWYELRQILKGLSRNYLFLFISNSENWRSDVGSKIESHKSNTP